MPLLTMLDLQNFQLKRSIHAVRYVYVFHSMGSTHGERSILPVCSEPLIAALLDAGIHVILRLHYQTAWLAQRVVDHLVTRFASDPKFSHVERMEESVAALRDARVGNVGRSVEVGAREIVRIADERTGARASGVALHAGRRRGSENPA